MSSLHSFLRIYLLGCVKGPEYNIRLVIEDHDSIFVYGIVLIKHKGVQTDTFTTQSNEKECGE